MGYTLLLCYWCTLSLVSASSKVAGLLVDIIDAAHHIPYQNVLQSWLDWTENGANKEFLVECVQTFPAIHNSFKLVCDVIISIKLDSLSTVQISKVITNESQSSGCYFNIKY